MLTIQSSEKERSLLDLHNRQSVQEKVQEKELAAAGTAFAVIAGGTPENSQQTLTASYPRDAPLREVQSTVG